MITITRRRLSMLVAGSALYRSCPARAAETELTALRSRGVIRIGTSGTSPPYTGIDFANNLTGYDIDWGNLIGKGLGLRVEWAKIDFRGLMIALQSGQVDALMSGIRITPEREQSFTFSHPYAYDETVAVVGSADTSIHDFAGIAGHQIAVVAGSFQEQVARSIPGASSIMALPSAGDVFMSLRTGHADVAVLGMSAISHYRKSGHTDFKVIATGAQATPQGVVFRKDAQDLKAAVDKIIDEKVKDGTYERLYIQHFGIAPPHIDTTEQ
ncbi:ABC transporter substrate-binding protein [Komagataeibacter xylinus]|uniref:Amino acid ABC transporter substrate-binding protein n=1 Tax=Komagataeibacter xylinus TaxID=28448 RepID=A0A857FS63_KOMXY|nr:ABC transporter substrate-binding protein [Komagataeibacter xylinus]QHC35304.1 amino acid ABC transporter substrate-binding protein [Komagataeibacter xylinus]